MERETIGFRLNDQGVYVPEALAPTGPVHQRSAPSQEAYMAALAEANDNFQILRDPLSGWAFEATINNESKLGQGAKLFVSTQASSLTTNAGNLIEQAARAADDPEIAHIYVAFWGNGGSHSMIPLERSFFGFTGRLTKGNGTPDSPYRPLDAVLALGRALTDKGWVPSYISGDEGGGRGALAVMSALDANVIKEGYLNGIPGMSPTTNYAGKMFAEDLASRRKRRQVKDYADSQPGDVVPPRLKEARQVAPRIYGGLGHLGRRAATYWHFAPNQLAYKRAFEGHADLGALFMHAALHDTLAGLRRQEAMLTLQVRRQSTIHNVDEAKLFAQAAMNHIPAEMRSEYRGLRLFIDTGSLDVHTDEPQVRWQAERQALTTIRRMFSVIFGRRGLDIPAPGEELVAIEANDIEAA